MKEIVNNHSKQPYNRSKQSSVIFQALQKGKHILIIDQHYYQMNLSVALVSDFFHPSLGGIELHIKQLAKYLKKCIKKVIIITHCRTGYYGLRDIQGIKTYYLHWYYAKSANVVFPPYFLGYSEAKEILCSEQINIVHTHQSASTLGTCYAIYAYHLGLKLIHTQHSLFDIRSNTYLYFTWLLSQNYLLYNKIICVSRAVRNNFAIRTYTSSKKLVVIPNAVNNIPITTQKRQKTNKIRIIVVGRLVFRRGTDLLIEILPILCQRNKNSNFSIEIIGDGEKFEPLKLQIAHHKLEDKVKLYGALANNKTLQIVKQCDIFLSTALTESFGIALVEASKLGLHCVSTSVGGIHQILPDEYLHLVQPTPSSIIMKLEQLIEKIQNKSIKPLQRDIRQFYKKDECFQRVTDEYTSALLEQQIRQTKTLCKNAVFKGSLPAIIYLIVIGIIYIIDFSHHLQQKLFKKSKRQ